MIIDRGLSSDQRRQINHLVAHAVLAKDSRTTNARPTRDRVSPAIRAARGICLSALSSGRFFKAYGSRARRSSFDVVHGELLVQGEVLQGELAVAAAEEREEAKQVEQEGDHRAVIVAGSEPTDQRLDRGRNVGEGQHPPLELRLGR